MADRVGRPDEQVRLVFGDREARIVSRYEVSQRFFTQPSAFSVTIGSGDTMAALVERFPPGTPFELRIGETVQQNGVIDGHSLSGSGGGTELVLRGRDALAPLHDDIVEVDRSFTHATYGDLVTTCIQEAGIKDFQVFAFNDANRLAVTGATRILHDNPSPEATAKLAQLVANFAVTPGAGFREGVSVTSAPTAPTVEVREGTPPLRMKVGESRYAFLKKYLDRAGLFIIAAAGKNVFVVTEPQTSQRPVFRIARRRGASTNDVTTIGAPRFRNEATRRFARYVVHGRGGGGVAGQEKVRGEFVDQEMTAWGFKKTWSKVDAAAKRSTQAQFLARRQCAEDRRSGWELVYTMPGHRAPVIGSAGRSSGQQWAIWAPDVMVDIQDDELGIHGPHWIEGVTFRGDGRGGTTTDVTVMRPEDLVFGETQ